MELEATLYDISTAVSLKAWRKRLNYGGLGLAMGHNQIVKFRKLYLINKVMDFFFYAVLVSYLI